MTVTSGEEGARTPWTIADMVKSVAFVAATAVSAVGGMLLLRPFLSPELATALGLAGAAIAELSMLLAVWLFGIRKYRLRWSAVGFRPFDLIQAIGLVPVILLASLAVNVVYVQAITVLGLEFLKPPPILPQSLTGIWQLIVPLALASGVAPVAEEVFFRGFVFGALRRRVGMWLAVGGSSLLFTLAHLQASVLVPIFLLGLLLAWLYTRSKSIWPCIALHLAYNSLALVLTYFANVSRSAS